MSIRRRARVPEISNLNYLPKSGSGPCRRPGSCSGLGFGLWVAGWELGERRLCLRLGVCDAEERGRLARFKSFS